MNRQEMIFKNNMIRGIQSMLKDYRMEQTDLAYQYLMDVTNSTTEDDIIPLLRGKSADELMKINVKVGSFIKQTPWHTGIGSLNPDEYKEFGKYYGD